MRLAAFLTDLSRSRHHDFSARGRFSSITWSRQPRHLSRINSTGKHVGLLHFLPSVRLDTFLDTVRKVISVESQFYMQITAIRQDRAISLENQGLARQ